MRKAGRIFALAAGMSIILGIAVTARAEEEMRSRGSFQFQSGVGSAQIWAEEIALLQGKLSGIPEEAFASDYYSELKPHHEKTANSEFL